MTGYNRVILMGCLTRDPQGGTLPSNGTAICEFSLAVNRSWRDADGNAREDVLFIDCTAFGRQAETLTKYLRKGRPLHVEGRLKLDRWEQDGHARSKIRVVVEQFRFVDSVRQSEDAPHDAATSDVDPPANTGNAVMRPPKQRVRRTAAAPAGSADGAGEGLAPPAADDDIPF